MEQRCLLPMVWLTWIGVPLLAVVVGIRTNIVSGIAVLIVAVVAQVLYVRYFPHLSKWVGYGSVADTPASGSAQLPAVPRVTLYTASACPFCPIVRQRLLDLQKRSGFELVEMDVTFRPQVIRDKGLRSVPVVEANGRTIVGNATSAQLADLLANVATD